MSLFLHFLGRVNAVGAVNRSVKEVKKKWQTYQSSVKSKEAKRISETKVTGGGPLPNDLTDIEKTVRYIFLYIVLKYSKQNILMQRHLYVIQ